jgi:hypothetical protein
MVCYDFQIVIISLNINQLIFVMVKCGVFFAAQTILIYYLDKHQLQS